MQAIEAREASWKDDWEWTKVQGAEGWWQILMQGVWVGGSRVLQNQAAVIDVYLAAEYKKNAITDEDSRSIVRSSLRLQWLPKRSMRPSLALVRCPHPTLAFTLFPA